MRTKDPLGIKNVCFSCMSDKDMKKDKRQAKYKKQRLAIGFDDSETWSLAHTISSFIVPRLERFIEVACCHPCYLTMDEWMDKCRGYLHFFQLQTLKYSVTDFLEKEGALWEETAYIEEIEYNRAQEYIKDFNKFFGHLWW